MFHNVGKIDRIIRFVAAVVLAVVYYSGIVGGDAASVTLFLAATLAITSLRRCCPIYALFGKGTCGIEKPKSEPKIKTKNLEL